MERISEEQGGDGSQMPGLASRLVAVFFSPGRLMEQLAEQPRWIGALIMGGLVVGLTMALIPVELFLGANRQIALERGAEFPELGERAIRAMRIVIPLTSVLTTTLLSAIIAGLYTIIFAFILGDEGRYAQYLAVVTHAWLIALLVGLLLTPLRISTGNAQFTLNMASFAFFLPEGYFLNVLQALDLTQIWSTLVIAQGAHAIDKRRSFKSAATILMVILVSFAMLIANFI
jgi:hypothetical protein